MRTVAGGEIDSGVVEFSGTERVRLSGGRYNSGRRELS